ncbi:MAG: potassium channel family protein [Nocardioides sp.]
MAGSRSSRRDSWVAALSLLAVLVLYFAIPVRTDDAPWRLALNLVLSLTSAGVIALITVRELAAGDRRERHHLRGLQLFLLFELALVVFALTYYALSVYSEDQMAGLETRLDALYFTATTMATVGYGDIHPIGQLARAVTTLHLAFNVLFVAVFARLLVSYIGRRHAPDGSQKDSAS